MRAGGGARRCAARGVRPAACSGGARDAVATWREIRHGVESRWLRTRVPAARRRGSARVCSVADGTRPARSAVARASVPVGKKNVFIFREEGEKRFVVSFSNSKSNSAVHPEWSTQILISGSFDKISEAKVSLQSSSICNCKGVLLL